MVTYDITDKGDPIEESRIDYFTDYIHINGSILCGVGFDKTIRVYDITNNANPNLVGTYYDGTDFGYLFVVNNHIFASKFYDGFIIIEFVESATTSKLFSLEFLALIITATIFVGYVFIKRKK